MDSAERERRLKEIAREIEKCERCALHYSRKRSVPGEGPVDAEIMFIGEAPGFHENEQGRPFVGAAGKLLDELLAGIELDRGRVFITNIIKSRPPGNRDPLPDELAACAPFLDRQIEILNPRVIVTLGRFSMAHFFRDAKISEIHGKAQWINGRMVVPMYHPAAALRQRSLKAVIERDFKKLPGFVEKARKSTPAAEPESAPGLASSVKADPPSQLSLFSPEQSREAGPDEGGMDETPTQLTLF